MSHSQNPISLLKSGKLVAGGKWLILGTLAVVFFANAAQCASLDDQQMKPDTLKDDSSLVKRAAPGSSAAYGHSIMRFGRAPHNIMHFGKRGGNYQGDLLDAYLDAANTELAADSSAGSSAELTGAQAVPEWILSNLVNGQKNGAVSNGHVTRYLLVPVQVPLAQAHYYQQAAASGLPHAPMSKKAKLTDETDNVFMHFG